MFTRNLLPVSLSLMAFAGLLSTTCQAIAQSAPTAPPDDNAVCTPGVRSYVEYGGISTSGEPYTATLKITFDKKLSDGTLLHGVTRVLRARDSSGKVRMETPIGCELDKDGHAYNKLIVRISDPLESTFLDWNTGGAVLKVARRSYQPDAMGGSAGIREWTDSERTVTTPGRSAVTTRIETIGTKKIDGIQALGQKMTITAVSLIGGNALPSVVTREQWISVEHGLLLADLLDDPDKGRTEMVMEKLSLKEPDPSLFVLPDGYTVTLAPVKAPIAR